MTLALVRILLCPGSLSLALTTETHRGVGEAGRSARSCSLSELWTWESSQVTVNPNPLLPGGTKTSSVPLCCPRAYASFWVTLPGTMCSCSKRVHCDDLSTSRANFAPCLLTWALLPSFMQKGWCELPIVTKWMGSKQFPSKSLKTKKNRSCVQCPKL